jgi:dihydrolipoamide dehydrogenase
MVMSREYDVAVLGGGPGGYVAAIRCAQYGLRTALIESCELGGTCLNRGCIPTKALLHGAEVWETIGNADKYGIGVSGVTFDYAALAAYKDRCVSILRRGVEALEKAHGVTVIRGFGTLKDANTLQVEGKEISADKIILATGSRPSLPPIEGAEFALTSDDVLSLKSLPQSVVIIGGGVIGIEFATLFATLGAKVTVLEMMDEILPGMEQGIVQPLKKMMKQKKVDFVTKAKVSSLSKDGTVFYELNGEKKSVSGQICVICTGRRPMTEGIGLETLGIATQRGYVLTDDRLRTNLPNVYAIGDITGKMQLAHMASVQGAVAAAQCAGIDTRINYRIVPACVYTHPEIACVGMTKQAATDAGYRVKAGSFDVAGNGRSMVMDERRGSCQIISDETTGEILGAQIMAPRASDMIAEIAAVMRCEGTIEELADTIHPHPTVSEIIMEASHDILGLSCHKMPGKSS